MGSMRTLTIDGHILPIIQGPPHDCSYLPGRVARETYVAGGNIHSGLYAKLMDKRFRRGGSVIYRPSCIGCDECVPIRVRVPDFAASRSQRRVWRRNTDIELTLGRPIVDEERVELYGRYQSQWHDGTMAGDTEGYRAFLAESPIRTVEMSYRAAGRLLGVGIVDVCPDSLSSVYFYFDPDESRRSLGVFSGLCELALAAQWGKAYWYLGYYVRECDRMNYKSRFRPCELLGMDGVWRRMENDAGSSDPAA